MNVICFKEEEYKGEIWSLARYKTLQEKLHTLSSCYALGPAVSQETDQKQ